MFYVCIVLVTILFSYLYNHVSREQKKFVFFLMIIVPAIVAGVRGVGTDYLLYKERFRNIQSGIEMDFSLIYEIMKIWGKCGFDYQSFTFFVSLITISIAFYLITQYENQISVPFAVFAYMTMFYQMSFNIFRQILATELLLLAYFYLIERKSKVKYCFFLVIAVSIHSATIVYGIFCVMLPLIWKKKFRIYRILSYITVATLVLLLPALKPITEFIAIRFPHYGYYMKYLKYGIPGPGFMRYVIICLLPIFSITYLKQYYIMHITDNVQHYVFFSIVGTILWLTSYSSVSDLYRIGYIGLAALPIVLGYIVKNSRKTIFNCLLNGMVILALVFSWWYDYIYTNSGVTFPYFTFLR